MILSEEEFDRTRHLDETSRMASTLALGYLEQIGDGDPDYQGSIRRDIKVQNERTARQEEDLHEDVAYTKQRDLRSVPISLTLNASVEKHIGETNLQRGQVIGSLLLGAEYSCSPVRSPGCATLPCGSSCPEGKRDACIPV